MGGRDRGREREREGGRKGERGRGREDGLTELSCTILLRQRRALGMRSWQREAILATVLMRPSTSRVVCSLWRQRGGEKAARGEGGEKFQR